MNENIYNSILRVKISKNFIQMYKIVNRRKSGTDITICLTTMGNISLNKINGFAPLFPNADLSKAILVLII